MTSETSRTPEASQRSGPVPADYAPFAHLTAPNAPLYRQVMRAFLAAKEGEQQSPSSAFVRSSLAPLRVPGPGPVTSFR
ncbi:hypothetical protein ACFP51_29200 [Streptomyces pratens]|uniref:Uncharacterized protein n=1 Tax=Streptomyces pratens TaxID=887456 RepID=A0ABW1MBD6_9ACTN